MSTLIPLAQPPGWKIDITKRSRVCHWFRVVDTKTSDTAGTIYETSLCGNKRVSVDGLKPAIKTPRCGKCNTRYQEGKR